MLRSFRSSRPNGSGRSCSAASVPARCGCICARNGHDVARCTVERIYAEQGWVGAMRAKKIRTTIADESAERPTDLVDRQFFATRPDQLWVADFTYVATWSGTVYVAFIFDVFSRRIVGWRAATRMTTDLVLDTLEHAIWTRSPGRC